MSLPVNTTLLKHPLNWITVFLMLFIAGMALHYILFGLGFKTPAPAQSGYGTKPASSSATAQSGGVN